MTPRIVAQRYELIEVIGRGGMGQVFRGFDRTLKRRVAVKFIHPRLAESEEWERRFVREAELMARMSHPGMATVFDAGIDPGPPEQPFLVMEYIDGVTLDTVLARRGNLPVGAVAGIAAQTAAVLAEAHGHSIFHRDLKPSNLMLCADGTVRVLDFGIALALDSSQPRLTRTGSGIGTPEYMAPEQVRGKTVVPQTDLYSLGLVMYELLTGVRAMLGGSEIDTMINQVNAAPPDLTHERHDVPEELAALVSGMLAKNPLDRPADAATVHAVLMRYIGALDGLMDRADPASPARLYATAVGASAATRTAPTQVHRGADSVPGYEFTRGDIDRAVRHARDLADESKYVPAVGELRGVLEVAVPQLGARDADVVDTRIRLADLCLESGDYVQAAALYSELIDDLTAERGPYDDQVMFCQRQLATCQVHSGQVRAALTRLRKLHAQLAAWHGENDPRVVQLGEMIAQIRAGSR
ncbi:serine/threonine-protein kinase [Nocardia neocaledoniensis]|uniref:serine/threonine-protein kinase n=1 Tax=Nocardia neocaledoniensis TaxID=236511 RepID=UPI002457F1EC|nr:serine/threonine-protein kinase [Nocardia neocaledoniensis]